MKTSIFQTVLCILIPGLLQPARSVGSGQDSLVSAFIVHIKMPVNIKREGNKVVNVFSDNLMVQYNYKDLVLYKLPGLFDWDLWKDIPNTEMYFLFQKNEQSGKYFRSLDKPPKFLPVDSMKQIFQGLTIADPDTAKRLILVSQSVKKNSLKKRYTIKDRSSPNTPEILELVFDKKLNSIDFSFSPELDKKYGMKLCKIVYSYRASSNYPKRDLLYEIKQESVKNQDSMIDIFERLAYRK